MGKMVRTNVVVDEALVEKVMRLYRLPTKRAAIDFALRKVAGSDDRSLIRELEGSGWEGDLDEMRGGDPIELL
ncbi:MAG: type II toxin-antitoxin system VapB family antitoxin [Actinomycetota bacterium]